MRFQMKKVKLLAKGINFNKINRHSSFAHKEPEEEKSKFFITEYENDKKYDETTPILDIVLAKYENKKNSKNNCSNEQPQSKENFKL